MVIPYYNYGDIETLTPVLIKAALFGKLVDQSKRTIYGSFVNLCTHDQLLTYLCVVKDFSGNEHNLGQGLSGPFVVDWYYCPAWNPEELRPVCACCSELFMETWINMICFFPPNMITTRPNHSQCTNRQLMLQQPFGGANACVHSFIPHNCHAWNLLPAWVVINLPAAFKE